MVGLDFGERDFGVRGGAGALLPFYDSLPVLGLLFIKLFLFRTWQPSSSTRPAHPAVHLPHRGQNLPKTKQKTREGAKQRRHFRKKQKMRQTLSMTGENLQNWTLLVVENHQQRSDDLWSIFAKNTEKKYFLEEKRHVNFPAAEQVASLSMLMKATWGKKRERGKK